MLNLKPEDALGTVVSMAGWGQGRKIVRLICNDAGAYGLSLVEVAKGELPGERWSVKEIIPTMRRTDLQEPVLRRDVPRAVFRLMNQNGIWLLIPPLFLQERDGLGAHKCSFVDLLLVTRTVNEKPIEIRFHSI